jgi:DNA-binding NarL/FixJ family response regulator
VLSVEIAIDACVQAGRQALERGDWLAARSAFEAALEDHESPEALDGLGQALFWQCEYAASIELRERAYAAFRTRRETRYPALIACWVGFNYAALYANFAAFSGWIQRARSLLEEAGDCPERGTVELYDSLMAADLDQKERHIEAAMAIAKRYGDTDLEFDALGFAGACLVERGRVQEGMRRLDEAAAAATNGEVKDPFIVGGIYCNMLSSCETALDVRRAEEWVAVAERFVRRSNFVPISAICRMHYGGILTAAGRWDEAEEELSSAVRIFGGGYLGLQSGAFVRLADLRVRQGRLEEAERLLAGHESDSHAIHAVALLHLTRGEAELASALVRRHLSQHGEGVVHAPLLALAAEADVAAGRLDEARVICAQLRSMAEETSLPLVRALAEFSAAIVCGSSADTEAVAHLEEALSGFATAGLPLEEARARLHLARTMASSNPKVAIAEARMGLVIFERLGATREADAAARVLRDLGVTGRTGSKRMGPLTKRETEVLSLVAEGLSNDQIAQRLYLSRRTVENHVAHVLTKLGLTSRTQAVAYAMRHLLGQGS